MSVLSAQQGTKSVASQSASATRLMAPDFARGLTLLGIAMANATTAWLPPRAPLPGASSGGILNNSIWDKVTIVLENMFVHVRGLPMFATLMGYGVGMIAMSLYRKQYPIGKARGVLARRYGFLALFGALHMVFIFFGDIMFLYGCVGILLGLMIGVSDKIMLWIAGGVAAFWVIFAVVGAMLVMIFSDSIANISNKNSQNSFFSQTQSGIANTYPEVLQTGALVLLSQVVVFFLVVAPLVPVMILGFVAARHNVLGRIEEFKKQLLIAAFVSGFIIIGIGMPLGFSDIGVFSNKVNSSFTLMNTMIGIYSGPGFVAMAALATLPLQRRINTGSQQGETPKIPLFVRMICALGKRSMTGYLLQSIVFFIITAPFMLNYGHDRGAFFSTIIAIGVWLVTLFAAWIMELLGKPGPFEAVHRRLSYGKNGLYSQYPGGLIAPMQPLHVQPYAPHHDGPSTPAPRPGHFQPPVDR